jgi:hypothetical protein
MRVVVGVLLATGCARAPTAVRVLHVPSMPPTGAVGSSSVGVGVSVPDGASTDVAWTSADPRIRCEPHGDVLTVTFTVAHPSEWPYELPDSAVCTQGNLRVELPLAFGAPRPERWFADDGTLVVPRASKNAEVTGMLAMEGLIDARVADAAGIACERRDRDDGARLEYRVDPGAAGSAVCDLLFASGERRAQRIAVSDY